MSTGIGDSIEDAVTDAITEAILTASAVRRFAFVAEATVESGSVGAVESVRAVE